MNQKAYTTIQEPNFGPEESQVYGEVLDTLDRAGIHYMLGGAIALNAYTGIWHDTKDLDVVVPEKAVAGALEALEAVGFETEVTDPLWLAKAWKGSAFADIIYADRNGTFPVEESWFDHAEETTVLNRRVLAVPAEEMILSIIFVIAKDRCDVSDVLHLIFATQGNLDWGRILAKIGEHRELLLAHLHLYRYVYPSHTHYLPRRVFAFLERYGEDTAPGKPLRFRGTMLDDASFSVDVEEWGLPDERAASREARRSAEKRG